MPYTSVESCAVRQLRLALDKTQEEMAEIFSVSRVTWNRWEHEGASGQVAGHMSLYAAHPSECGAVLFTELAVNDDGFDLIGVRRGMPEPLPTLAALKAQTEWNEE